MTEDNEENITDTYGTPLLSQISKIDGAFRCTDMAYNVLEELNNDGILAVAVKTTKIALKADANVHNPKFCNATTQGLE